MANTIQGTFGLDINPLRVAANRALALGSRLGRGFAGVLSGPLARIAGAFAAIGGTAAFARGIKSAYDLGGALNDLSARTGESVRTLFILRQQLEDNGVEAGALGGIINKLQKSLGSKEGQKTLAQLGLRFKDLKTLTPAAQFIAIGKAINSVGDPALRAQRAMALFGKSGGELLAIFSDPDFGSGGGNLQRQADLLARNASTFDTVSDRLARVGTVLRGFFLGIADRVSSTLLPILTKFETIDLIGTGQKFGDAMLVAAQVFLGAFANPGAVLDFFTATLMQGLATAGNFLAGIFLRASAVLGEGVALAVNILQPIGNMLAGSALEFAGKMMTGLSGVIALLSTGLIFAFQKAVEFFDGAMKNIIATIGAGLITAAEGLLITLGKVPVLGEKLGLKGFEGGGFTAAKTALKAIQGPAFKAKSFADVAASQTASTPMSAAGLSLEKAGAALRGAGEMGVAKIAESIQQFKDNAESIILTDVTPDIFGASAFAARAAAAVAALKTTGAAVLGSAGSPVAPVAKGFGVKGLGAIGTNSSLSSSGLSTNGGLGKAYGLVRRGDAARAKTAAKSPEVDAIETLGQKMDDYWGKK